MTETKPKKKANRVYIHPVIKDRIVSNCSEYQLQQGLSKIVNDLLDKSLTQCAILNKPRTEGSEGAKVYSNNNKDKEKKYSEEFQKFWDVYRSAPEGVNSPKKPRAFDEFCLTVKSGIKSDLLIKAAQIAVRDQNLKLETTGECLCLPDAFRWLKDGVYESLLDEAATAPQQYNSNEVTIL